MRLLSIRLAAAALVAAVPAQERRAVPGRFVDAAGAPVAGARVLAVWTPLAGAGLAPADVVTAVTDAAGRFRLELWPTLAYTATAVGPVRADGESVVGRPVRAHVGGVVELRARQLPGAPAARFGGLDAWAARGPFAVAGYCGWPGVETFAPALGDDGVVRLPHATAVPFGLDLRDATGGVLFAARVFAREPAVDVDVPAPVAFDVVARDADGAPLPDVALRWAAGATGHAAPGGLVGGGAAQRWLGLGRTDASGRARVELPLGRHPRETGWELLVAGERDGYAGATAGWTLAGLRIDDAAADAPDALQLALRPPRACGVRVHRAGAPVAGVRVAVLGQCGVTRGARYQSYERQFFGATGADGGFGLAHIPRELSGLRVLLALPGEGGPPRLLPMLALDDDAVTDVDLARLAATTLTVRTATGVPAEGAMVVLMTIGEAVSDDWVEPLHCDRGGRVTVRSFRPTLAFAATDDEWGHTVVDGARDAAPPALELRPMARMAVRVVDAAGDPVPGAMLSLESMSHAGARGDDVDAQVTRLIRHLNHALRNRHRTDADGRLALPFVEDEAGSVTLSAWRSGLGRSAAVPLRATPAGEVVELTITER